MQHVQDDTPARDRATTGAKPDDGAPAARYWLAVLAALALAGCAGEGKHAGHAAAHGTAGSPSAHSDATVQLLDSNGRVSGRATLADSAQGVQLKVAVFSLSPGLHGFHVHTNGSCSVGPDAATGKPIAFGAAGPHFDPGNSSNHGRPGQHHTVAHAGELPNLDVAANGVGSLDWNNPNITVAPGPRSVMGRTLVVHAKPDDYESDPAGNSGDRVLCGLIQPGETRVSTSPAQPMR